MGWDEAKVFVFWVARFTNQKKMQFRLPTKQKALLLILKKKSIFEGYETVGRRCAYLPAAAVKTKTGFARIKVTEFFEE